MQCLLFETAFVTATPTQFLEWPCTALSLLPFTQPTTLNASMNITQRPRSVGYIPACSNLSPYYMSLWRDRACVFINSPMPLAISISSYIYSARSILTHYLLRYFLVLRTFLAKADCTHFLVDKSILHLCRCSNTVTTLLGRLSNSSDTGVKYAI